MPTNLEELKSISPLMLIGEITEKTKNCGMTWDQVRPGQYKFTNDPFVFHITKTSGDTVVMDVAKNGAPFRTYNSGVFSELEELYMTVDLLGAQAVRTERLKAASRFVGQISTCRANAYNETMAGGVAGAGVASAARLQPTSLLLRPTSLTFGPTLFPWSGSVTDIDDAPNASSHDFDSTYIRQQVSGALPTQWGYATCGFNLSGITFAGPYRFDARVAHRRETQLGVIIFMDVIINSTVVFSAQQASPSSYTLLSTNQQTFPDGFDTISDLQVRLSMFTNSGNEEPRALRVSAVDITIYGYNSV